MRSITVTEIRDHQNQRQTSRPYVTVRRFDGRYHVMAKIEGLEHTHKTGYKDRSVAWQLVKRVRQHLDGGNDLNLEHWDTEDPDPGGSSVHEEHPSEGRGVTPCEALPEVTVPIRTGLVTLTGYLGGDPEYRETEEREISGTRTRREHFVVQNGSHFIRDSHDVLEDDEEYTFVKAPRGYGVFSLATHQFKLGRTSTEWHRVIAWNTDHDHFGLFRLGKGDRVEIVARPGTYTTRDGRELEQLELVRFQLLRRKVRQIYDES